MLEIKTGLLALGVLATGVAGVGAWRSHGFHGGGHGDRHHALMARFIDFTLEQKLEELKATDAQKQKVREIKDQLVRDGKALHDDRAAFREEVLALVSRDDLDAAALRALVKSRTDAFVRFADDATQAVVDLHATLTPEQRALLLSDVREHLAEHR
jgi:Spy/CpxP family protein refolding chaperone